jgi:translation elongation factor EF-1beta
MNSSSKEGRKNNNKRKRRFPPHSPDSLDIHIINELLSNADISSSEIASKISMPLSTIQRRRRALESTPMVEHQYTLDPISFGLRQIEFWVLVEKGKADIVARRIFEQHDNILSVCKQMNSISDLGVVAYVTSSEHLYNTLEGIKSIPFVDDIEFAEIVKVMHTRQVNFFKKHSQAHIIR